MKGLGLAWVVAPLVGVLAIAGCSSQSASSSAAKPGRVLEGQVASLQAQNAGLQDLLLNTGAHTAVDPEPRGDVMDGLYEAEVSAVSSGALVPALTLDVITHGSAPGTDSHGWNRYPHVQSVPVGPRGDGSPANLVLAGPHGLDHGLEVVQVSRLAQRFGQVDGAGEYYVEIVNGSADRVWPVAYP